MAEKKNLLMGGIEKPFVQKGGKFKVEKKKAKEIAQKVPTGPMKPGSK